jgi:hypothetical protein
MPSGGAKPVAAWTVEEDEALVKAVSVHGSKAWSAISCALPRRTGKACRERWFGHLSPVLENAPWSATEDVTLAAERAQHGERWDRIARSLHGRTEAAAKQRWETVVRFLPLAMSGGVSSPMTQHATGGGVKRHRTGALRESQPQPPPPVVAEGLGRGYQPLMQRGIMASDLLTAGATESLGGDSAIASAAAAAAHGIGYGWEASHEDDRVRGGLLRPSSSPSGVGAAPPPMLTGAGLEGSPPELCRLPTGNVIDDGTFCPDDELFLQTRPAVTNLLRPAVVVVNEERGDGDRQTAGEGMLDSSSTAARLARTGTKQHGGGRGLPGAGDRLEISPLSTILSGGALAQARACCDGEAAGATADRGGAGRGTPQPAATSPMKLQLDKLLAQMRLGEIPPSSPAGRCSEQAAAAAAWRGDRRWGTGGAGGDSGEMGGGVGSGGGVAVGGVGAGGGRRRHGHHDQRSAREHREPAVVLEPVGGRYCLLDRPPVCGVLGWFDWGATTCGECSGHENLIRGGAAGRGRGWVTRPSRRAATSTARSCTSSSCQTACCCLLRRRQRREWEAWGSCPSRAAAAAEG